MLGPQAQALKKLSENQIQNYSSGDRRLNYLPKEMLYCPTQEHYPIRNQLLNDRIKSNDKKLDLNELLISQPDNTFLIRVTGDSMLNAGIHPGDILLVDRTIEASNDKIVVAEINQKLVVKRIRYNKEDIRLISENDNYPDIIITPKDDFNIWGVVDSVIKSV
jgi:DNA polymerase V